MKSWKFSGQQNKARKLVEVTSTDTFIVHNLFFIQKNNVWRDWRHGKYFICLFDAIKLLMWGWAGLKMEFIGNLSECGTIC